MPSRHVVSLFSPAVKPSPQSGRGIISVLGQAASVRWFSHIPGAHRHQDITTAHKLVDQFLKVSTEIQTNWQHVGGNQQQGSLLIYTQGSNTGLFSSKAQEQLQSEAAALHSGFDWGFQWFSVKSWVMQMHKRSQNTWQQPTGPTHLAAVPIKLSSVWINKKPRQSCPLNCQDRHSFPSSQDRPKHLPTELYRYVGFPEQFF